MTDCAKRFFFSFVFLALGFNLAGCAYRLGGAYRSLPGGYKQISIPIFKNHSQEVGVEVAFTQALLQEFYRSSVATVVDDPLAEVRLEGDIKSIQYLPEAKLIGDTKTGTTYLPQGAVLASQYRVLVDVNMRLIRRSDGYRLWESNFPQERTYAAPQVTLTGLNTVNPLYNLSARRQILEVMAGDMMVEAHSRITENF